MSRLPEMADYPPEFTVRLRNFASFIDSDTFTVRPGINTFIGLNNAGKTALLFALANFSSAAKALPLAYPIGRIAEFIKRYRRAESDPVIDVTFPIQEKRKEILDTLCALASSPKYPESGDLRDSLRFTWVFGTEEIGLANIYSTVYHEGNLRETELLRIVQSTQQGSGIKLIVAEHPYRFKRPDTYRPPEFEITNIGSRTDLKAFKFRETPNQLTTLWPSIFEQVVLLSTHRNPPSRAQHGYSIALDPVASNLTQVLATMQMSSPELENGRDLFDSIEKELRVLFPEIRRVRTEIVPAPDRSGQPLEMEIKLDLTSGGTVPISHSGTGVQQVLALLTGAVSSNQRAMFLLDEPHSYLHPAAERGLLKLLGRLGEERGHFFCIATHSPIFASHARNQLYAVTVAGDKGSKIRGLSSAAEILDTIGITNPDLFTYNRVVFVEGPSDEKVVTTIADRVLAHGEEYRLKVQRLDGNGILKNRSRAEFVSLLHKANATEIHVPIRFILDSHDWSKDERQRLQNLKDDKGEPAVHFLNLAEIENYLLRPEAVTYALERRLALRGMNPARMPNASTVQKIIDANKGLKGSDVLQAVFANWNCDYSKNKDVQHVLEYLLEHAPDSLRSLADELKPVLSAGTS